MRIGIMGGTFDPIHYGHLFIAEEARVRYHLDQVLFIPNGEPPHKHSYPITPAQHRFQMTMLATEPNRTFACSDIEVRRDGPSYSVDTLRELHRLHADSELLYITGVDAVADILTWHRHQEVIALATFIAATRPGFDLHGLKTRLPASYHERILLLESNALEISSSDIRARLTTGLPARYLTPDSVLEYIRNHRLYSHQYTGHDTDIANAGNGATSTYPPLPTLASDQGEQTT